MQHQSCPIILMDTNLHFYQTRPDLGYITMQAELNLTSKEMLGKKTKQKKTQQQKKKTKVQHVCHCTVNSLLKWTAMFKIDIETSCPRWKSADDLGSLKK